MALLTSSQLFICSSTTPYTSSTTRRYKRLSPLLATASSSSSSSSNSTSSTQSESISASKTSSKIPSNKHAGTNFNYPLDNPNGSPVVRFFQLTESSIERVIFDFRFLALFAVAGSLAGSLLCFLNGCIYIFDAYKVYWTSCVKGIHTGKMVLLLVEAIDVYLAGTVMLIFGMGLYGLFITNVPPDLPPSVDRALKGSSLFGMFALKLFLASGEAKMDDDQFT
ncbi:hypothetical protein Leryth_027408 [Lithospermum erythrorhizon]|nr:hypothetical protein Leryth_027408 [Lithospermum erythrorhizon]